jgi:type I restriction-modification system DNA methylase subunit
MGFPDAFQQISSLVNDFKENEKHYLNPSYSEADVRNDFINKFFIALGWDVRHETQKNPYEQEVRVEKPVTVAKAQKRADYTFYLAPNFRDVKFFVEAKKPSHDLENKDYYFQTVRYGWNANTPVAVLTDFEEFVILDCRFRPDINDILNYKLKSLHYSDYADEEKLKEIYYLFSREAVSDNSISKYVETLPKPRGKKKARVKEKYQNIDEAFLEELDEIRTRLAKSFKKNNTHLSSDELTEATQRTIDRLVFIKFLEDKMIEPHHYVSEFGKRRTAWEDFITASRTLDAKYNGVVFKKTTIDSRSIVEPDDKTFSSICDELSHENSPYNFDAIPIHILGSIYERFLGKVVNATDKRVTIEEKPEVRKAGGVYYTPQYIVNYIVDNTVVKLIEGKTPKEIAKMRFADIACGSGSFLITVYERLIDYHKQWYQQHPEQAKKDGCILFEGAYRLSLQQKQKILLNNIYGVDLDQQAVEVTQLSLYLKLLEDETTATANDTWVMFKEQLLPDLNKNIICGNSLIGNDILEGNLFDYQDEKKLKPMDFENVFPEVMKAGGFDAIVGNPPYIKIQNLTLYNSESISYLKKKYYSAQRGSYDIYIVFVERAFNLLNSNGKLGYILPHKFFNSGYGINLRDLLISNKSVEMIVHFDDYQIFKNASTYTCLLFLSKRHKSTIKASKIKREHFNPSLLDKVQFIDINTEVFMDKDWNIISSDSRNLINKFQNFEKLADITNNIFQGPKAGADNVFIFNCIKTNVKTILCYSDSLEEEFEIERGIVKPYIKGKYIKKYFIDYSSNYFTLYPYNNEGNLLPISEIKKLYPLAFEYLDHANNRKILLKRENGRFKNNWWSYSRPQNMQIVFSKKILTPFNAFNNSYALDKMGDFVFSAGVSGAYGIIIKEPEIISYEFLIGLLNSTLFEFLIKSISTSLRGGFYSYENKYIRQLPIIKPEKNDPIYSIIESSSRSNAHHKKATTASQNRQRQKLLRA